MFREKLIIITILNKVCWNFIFALQISFFLMLAISLTFFFFNFAVLLLLKGNFQNRKKNLEKSKLTEEESRCYFQLSCLKFFSLLILMLNKKYVGILAQKWAKRRKKKKTVEFKVALFNYQLFYCGLYFFFALFQFCTIQFKKKKRKSFSKKTNLPSFTFLLLLGYRKYIKS